jgi:hypothetical protein
MYGIIVGGIAGSTTLREIGDMIKQKAFWDIITY